MKNEQNQNDWIHSETEKYNHYFVHVEDKYLIIIIIHVGKSYSLAHRANLKSLKPRNPKRSVWDAHQYLMSSRLSLKNYLLCGQMERNAVSDINTENWYRLFALFWSRLTTVTFIEIKKNNKKKEQCQMEIKGNNETLMIRPFQRITRNKNKRKNQKRVKQNSF